MRARPKRGVAIGLLVALAVALPGTAHAGVLTTLPAGESFSATVSYPTVLAYGERARISGHISSPGWKITLFLRAAGETRYHPAGNVGTGRGRTYATRTGRLVRTTRFKLVYTRGRNRVEGRPHVIAVQAQVRADNFAYASDGSLHFRVQVLPTQPAGARVRLHGVDTSGASRDIVTLGLTRSGAVSSTTAIVSDPLTFSSLEVQFLGSSSNRPASAFFTPPPPP